MDSVQFALALEKYDVTVHQPHPPGYFLYVMLGRFFNLFIKDANSVFITISIIFSGFTVIAIYYLGKELYNNKTGLLSAAIAITSPSLWFHGEVALSYIVEAFFSTAVAFLCWKVYKGKHQYLLLSVIALGIAGGIRQNTVIFLLPLWFFSVKKVPMRKVIPSIGLLCLVCLLWFTPMVWMTGGWPAYKGAFRELWLFNTGHHTVFEKGWPMFMMFSSTLFDFTMYGIGGGILALGLTAYSLFRHGRYKQIEMSMAMFLALWILPSFLFYLLIFIHPANPGYVLIFLPALFILIGASIGYINDELKQITKSELLLPITLVLIAINMIIFYSTSYPVSHKWIKNRDRDLSIMLEEIKSFDPLKTAIFVGPYIFFGYRQIMYYLPEYRVYQVDTRLAPTGEVRKTFWGISRETFLTDEIILPASVDNFIIPLISDDKDKVIGIEEISIKNLNTTNIYIALGHISLIKNIYPELKVRSHQNEVKASL
jgi:uncharacterized membrane protein